MPNQENILVSCFYGGSRTKVHPAPEGIKCLFFTNNPALESEITSKGWEYRLHDKGIYSVSTSIVKSSLQSKYVKYLQFMRDYSEFSQLQSVFYCDHKAHILPRHLGWMKENVRPNAALMMRYSPKKKNINDEIAVASRHGRYAQAMPQTLEWINSLRAEERIDDLKRVSNTGLMYFKDIQAIKPLLDQVHSACLHLRQPECQIIWTALCKPYVSHLHEIEWFDMDVAWGVAKT